MEPKETVGGLHEAFLKWTEVWDRCGIPEEKSAKDLEELPRELHRCNYLVWNNEDLARKQDLPNGELRRVKNTVDTLNQHRNDTIELIDEFLLTHYFSHLMEADLPMRTETPGSAIDRLSVLSLKIFRMREQTQRSNVDEHHVQRCNRKLGILLQQRADLEAAILQVLTDLGRGIIKMKLYRQFKMYNDPNLNPALYKTDVKPISGG
jgi:hypothetical protein